MKSKSIVAPTAADVRAYFRADAKRLDRLSPEAQRTVIGVDGKAPRGRLHKDAVKVYNAKRKADRRYVLGASTKAKAVNAEQRKALREAGLLGEKARGPLSKAAKEFLAQSK